MKKFEISLVLAIVFAAAVTTGYQPPKETTEPCNTDADCKIPLTFCAGNTAHSSGLCSCTKDHVLKTQGNKFECLEEAQFFNDDCQIDDQCKPKLGVDAACIGLKCKCRPGAHFINLMCWNSRKLGETCGNPNNCVATEHSECSGTCKCVPGYIGNPANTKCLKIAQNIGDPCEDSVQCTPVNPLVTCQYKVCFCPAGYNPQGNSCIKPPVYQPPVQQPPPNYRPHGRHPNYNSATSIKENFAMIAIALVVFCLKI